MSRDNFFVQVKGKDSKPVYIHLDNIAYVEEVTTKDGQHTVVHLVGGTKVEIQDSMLAIQSKAAAFGVAKIVG
jgi:phage repressor protein C with HTH and peptisase S24 domain